MGEAGGRGRGVVRAAKGGLLYFVAVFAVGFLLGAARVLLLVPRLGETIAVLIELPLILAVSWIACRFICERVGVPPLRSERAVMGGVAFALLMVAEIGLSMLGFGRTFAEHLDVYRHLPGLLGLAGQIAFATFPIVQARAAGLSRA